MFIFSTLSITLSVRVSQFCVVQRFHFFKNSVTELHEFHSALTDDRENYVHVKRTHACPSISCQSYYFAQILLYIFFFFFFSPSNADRFKFNFNFLILNIVHCLALYLNFVGSTSLVICTSQKVLCIDYSVVQSIANLNIYNEILQYVSSS